jgi:hypothetical protein
MVDDTSEIAGPVPDPARPKRPPPTIDLEPTSSETRPVAADAVAEGGPDAASEAHPAAAPEPNPEPELESKFEPKPEPAPELKPEVRPESKPERPPIEKVAAAAAPPVSASMSPWVIAPVSGAVAAALVIGVGWMLGWPKVTPPGTQPRFSTVVEGLNTRIGDLEARLGKSDSATAARTDALDKALAALRGDLSPLRTQVDKTAAAINDLKAAPPRDASGAVDLSALNARIDQIERASRTQSAAQAQTDSKIAEAKPTDDVALRRVIAAVLLDVAVRHGDPYAAVLSTTTSLAPKPEALKPLEAFAATGVPSPAALGRDLLTIVPKLTPQAAADSPTTGSSIVDKLQAGAAKLVRIERTDSTGTDRGAVVARITAAALRNDYVEARRELTTLPVEIRAPALPWIEKANARDAALATSRQFADEAMTALAKPSQ